MFWFFLLCFSNVLIHICQSSLTNNWAILVDTSKFWFNYRHVGNVLGFYRSVKKLGIPDSRIILMIADDAACNPRNPYPGSIYNTAYDPIDLYGDDIEIDYRGSEVTVENFIRVLTNRQHPSTPNSKRLLTDQHSNILIYITGHGGDKFIKFQDENEISSQELADAFEQMWQKRRYNEIFFIADTCQAESLSLSLYSPNILGVGSSRVGEDSLSHHRDENIGVFVADRYSYYALEFLEKIRPDSKATLKQFLNVCPYDLCHSHVTVRTDLYNRDPNKVLVTEFFSNIREVDFLTEVQKFNVSAQYKQSQRGARITKNLDGLQYYQDTF